LPSLVLTDAVFTEGWYAGTALVLFPCPPEGFVDVHPDIQVARIIRASTGKRTYLVFIATSPSFALIAFTIIGARF
jgi:hypothetical protein